jgi:hypothetical protein
MSQESSLTQSAHSVRQVLTAYTWRQGRLETAFRHYACRLFQPLPHLPRHRHVVTGLTPSFTDDHLISAGRAQISPGANEMEPSQIAIEKRTYRESWHPPTNCNDDGGDEHEDRSDENDGQCVPHFGPQEHSD